MLVAILEAAYQLFDRRRLIAARRIGGDQREVHIVHCSGIGKPPADRFGEVNMTNRIVKDAIFGAIAGVAGTFVLEKAMGFFAGFQSKRDKWIERELVKEDPTQ